MTDPDARVDAHRTHLAPPSAEQTAAIVAAVEMTWPRPGGVDGADSGQPAPRWRFSGRWWTKPVPSRRDRPF